MRDIIRAAIYEVWKSMVRRCTCPTHKSFHRYGARGITVCEEWLTFQNFYDWSVNNGYQRGLQLDRQNNDIGYCPENCCFVTPKVNANNRSTNHRITYKGETHTLTEWAELLNMDNHVLRNRIVTLNWSVDRAFTQPVVRRNHYANC